MRMEETSSAKGARIFFQAQHTQKADLLSTKRVFNHLFRFHGIVANGTKVHRERGGRRVDGITSKEKTRCENAAIPYTYSDNSDMKMAFP